MPRTMKNKGEKKGVSGVLASFRDAFRGLGYCLKTQGHMRFHLAAALLVLAAGFLAGLSGGRMGLLCLTIGAVISAEAFNTALEKLCDFVEPKHNLLIGVIKDAAAGAVLAAAIAAVGVGIFVFLVP